MKKTILIFSNNIVSTGLTQTVVRLHNCRNSAVIDNVITFGINGNAVAFDTYKY